MAKVRAMKDGFMGDGYSDKYTSKFCSEGKEYEVINKNKDTFKIIDDEGDEHTFAFDDSQWFEFMEAEE